MSDEPGPCLSGEEVVALRFAANHQLARWNSKPRLSEHQHSQRAALRRAVHLLRDDALTHGCELRSRRAEGDR